MSIEPVLYAIGSGLKEKAGKGSKLFPVSKPINIAASIKLDTPACGKCRRQCRKKEASK